MTVLRHYSPVPLEVDFTRLYKQESSYKPHGLWLSAGDAWKEWCEAEEFAVASLVHSVDVELTAGANVMTITTPDELRRMTMYYKTTRAADYDGIIIAPYQWECRLEMETFWYYGWDCASACVWNLRAIRLVHER